MYGQYLVILRYFLRYAFDSFESIRSRASRAYPYTYRFGSVRDLANAFVANFDLLPFLAKANAALNLTSSSLSCKSVSITNISFSLHIFNPRASTAFNLMAGSFCKQPDLSVSRTFVEFKDVEFYWVDCQLEEKFHYSNLSYLTKDDLCDTLHII